MKLGVNAVDLGKIIVIRMPFHYQFIESESLLIHKHIGEFSLEMFKSYFLMFLKLENPPEVKRMIIDFRESEVSYNLELIKKIVDFRSNQEVEMLRSVMIVDKPETTVFSQMYISELKLTTYEVCSTLRYALKYLNLSMTEKELDNALLNLEFVYDGD